MNLNFLLLMRFHNLKESNLNKSESSMEVLRNYQVKLLGPEDTKIFLLKYEIHKAYRQSKTELW